MINLSQREKRLAQLLGGVVGFALLYFLVISPLANLKRGSEGQIRQNMESIAKIDSIYDEYKDIRQKKTQYMAQLANKNANITSLIEQWATSANITKNIAYTRRTQTNIQNKYVMTTTIMKVDSVAIEPLLKFIYEVENSSMLLKVSYIRMREAIKGSDTYDVELKINTYSTQ
jgi:hypothetical protein